MEVFSMEIAGLTLVTGLEWQALVGGGSAGREKRAIAQELGATRLVEMSSSQETVVGFLPPEGAADLAKKAYSLPALLAGVPNISPYCVLIVEDGDVALLAALQDGLPAPGFDGYGSTEAVIAAAREFINMAPQGVTVYGNCNLLDASPLTIQEVVATSKTKAQALLKGLPNPVFKYGIFAALIGILGFSAHYAYDYRQKQEQLAAQKLTYVNVDAKYLENVALLLKNAPPAKTVFAMLKEAVDHTESQNNGWNLAGILCNKQGCTYTWANNGGTNDSFVPPPNATVPIFTDRGEALSYQMPYAQPLPTGLISATAPTIESVRRDTIGKFQAMADLQVSAGFDKVEIFGLPGGLPNAPSKTFKEGTFTVIGPWYAMDALENLPDVTAFESLEVSLSAEQQISFKAIGKYYVK